MCNEGAMRGAMRVCVVCSLYDVCIVLCKAGWGDMVWLAETGVCREWRRQWMTSFVSHFRLQLKAPYLALLKLSCMMGEVRSYSTTLKCRLPEIRTPR